MLGQRMLLGSRSVEWKGLAASAAKRHSDQERMREIAELTVQFNELDTRIEDAKHRAERVKVICKLMRPVRAARKRRRVLLPLGRQWPF
jgi:hypothetical protein